MQNLALRRAGWKSASGRGGGGGGGEETIEGATSEPEEDDDENNLGVYLDGLGSGVAHHRPRRTPDGPGAGDKICRAVLILNMGCSGSACI